MMTSIAKTDEEQDRQEILRLHTEWFESNCGIDIPRMQKVFAGEKYLMFNLNAHPYYGLSEKTKLWEHYRETLDIPKIPERWDVRVNVRGDVGWVTCEGVLCVRAKQPEGTGASLLPASEEDYTNIRFRSTEIYVRDDGEGNPVWKMWHFHCSPLAPENEPRPGFA
jgi:hypothetical protein